MILHVYILNNFDRINTVAVMKTCMPGLYINTSMI